MMVSYFPVTSRGVTLIASMTPALLARQILGYLNPTGHPDSYFLWIPLTGEIRAGQVASRLAAMKIAVSTAEPFSVAANPPNALRIALGSVDLPALKTALQQVREVIEYFRDL